MRIVIAGGGTGGHLFPGVAVAEELVRQQPDAQVTFVGTKRGIEYRVLPKLGWPLKLIEISGIKTVGAVGAVRGLIKIPRSLWQSRMILKELKPDVVLGVGGYASGPLVLMARLRGIPTAILEQNSVPGLTNKILGRITKRVFLAFEESRHFFPVKKSDLVGNPIRQSIRDALQHSQSSNQNQKVRLFVFGGSQGASAVNALVVEAAKLLTADEVSFSIVHQTGKAELEKIRASYNDANIEASCHSFIEDMAKEYKEADVVIARAGATTIAELAIAGRVAILIPYPHAAQNHQEKNAHEMVEADAAFMCLQDETSPVDLAAILRSLMSAPDKRKRMSAAMSAFAKPNAAAEVVRWCVDQMSHKA